MRFPRDFGGQEWEGCKSYRGANPLECELQGSQGSITEGPSDYPAQSRGLYYD